MKFLIIYLIVVLFHLWHAIGNAQQCLHTEKGEDTGTPFRDDSNSPTLPTGSQAIIETYMFHCCGWITEWRAYVKPGGRTRYNISFQVWRPAVSQAAGCFTLVGENKFANIMLNGKEVKVSPSSGIIHFQEGDVVGYYLTRLNGNRNEGGIQLETMESDYRNDVIWYNISNNNPVNSIPENCPFCTGAEALLPTSTRAAPAISVAFSTSQCTISPSSGSETVNLSSSTLSTSTTETTAPVNPTTFAVAVLAALGGFILLFIFLTIFVIRIKKRSKTTKASIETNTNKAYGLLPDSCPGEFNNAHNSQQTVTKASIETNTNKAYGLLPDSCPREFNKAHNSQQTGNANNPPLDARKETFELLSIVSGPNEDITSSRQPEYDYIIHHDLEPI